MLMLVSEDELTEELELKNNCQNSSHIFDVPYVSTYDRSKTQQKSPNDNGGGPFYLFCHHFFVPLNKFDIRFDSTFHCGHDGACEFIVRRKFTTKNKNDNERHVCSLTFLLFLGHC